MHIRSSDLQHFPSLVSRVESQLKEESFGDVSVDVDSAGIQDRTASPHFEVVFGGGHRDEQCLLAMRDEIECYAGSMSASKEQQPIDYRDSRRTCKECYGQETELAVSASHLQ